MASPQLLLRQLEEHGVLIGRMLQEQRVYVDKHLSEHARLMQDLVKVALGGNAGNAPGRSASSEELLRAYTSSRAREHALDGDGDGDSDGERVHMALMEMKREARGRKFGMPRNHSRPTTDSASDETSESDHEDCTSKLVTGVQRVMPFTFSNSHFCCAGAAEALMEQRAHDFGTIEPQDRLQACLLPIVSSSWFQCTVFVFILFNALVLAVEVHVRVTNELNGTRDNATELYWFEWLEVFFLATFNCEILARLLAERRDFFTGPNKRWNICEALIVLFCVVDQVQERFKGEVTWSITVFIRNLRIFRAVRIIRIFRFLRQLRLMLFSIVSCLVSFSWALLLMLIMVATFAMYLEDVILLHFHRNAPVDRSGEVFETLDKNWKGIDLALRSLVYSITGGSDWGDLVQPFWVIEPAAGVLYIFFILFIIFGLLNVLVGIFVEQAGEIAHWDEHAVFEAAVSGAATKEVATSKVLSELFALMDKGQSGHISIDQLRSSLQDPRIKAYFNSLQIDMVENADVFFELLDEDGTGFVDKAEFVGGCMRLQGGAKGLDIARLQLEARRTSAKLDHLEHALTSSLSMSSSAKQ